jgi:hypothetical protein
LDPGGAGGSSGHVVDTAADDDDPPLLDDPDAIVLDLEGPDPGAALRVSTPDPSAPAAVDPLALDIDAVPAATPGEATAVQPSPPAPPATATDDPCPPQASPPTPNPASSPSDDPLAGLELDDSPERELSGAQAGPIESLFQDDGDAVDLGGLSESELHDEPTASDRAVSEMPAADPLGVAGGPAAALELDDEHGNRGGMPALSDREEEVRPASLDPVERLRRSTPGPGQTTKRPRLRRVANVLMTAGGIVALVLELSYSLAADHAGSVVSLLMSGTWTRSAQARVRGPEGVQLRWMRSQLYPTREGVSVLVVCGEVANRSSRSLDALWAVVELRSPRGGQAVAQRAPVGVALRPPELYRLTDSVSVQAAYLDRAASLEPPRQRLAPGQTGAFTAVFLKPPRRLRELAHSVRLEPGASLGLPPAAPPAPLPAEADTAASSASRDGDKPPAPSDSAGVSAEPTEGKPKRRGRRGKRRRVRPRGKAPGT